MDDAALDLCLGEHVLNSLLETGQAVHAEEQHQIMSLRGTVEECDATISSLREQVEYLTRKLFGTSSERSKTVAG